MRPPTLLSINDVEVSRRHARMELQGSSYVIQDLGSTNGTFVNGQRVTGVQPLNPGDSVSFGEGIILSYEAAFDPNATMMSSKASRPAPVRRTRSDARTGTRTRPGLLRPGTHRSAAPACRSSGPGQEEVPHLVDHLDPAAW